MVKKTLSEVYALAVPIMLSSAISVGSLLVNTRILAAANTDYLYILAIYLPVSILIIALLEAFQAVCFAFSSQAKGSNDMTLFSKRLTVLFSVIAASCLGSSALFCLFDGYFFEVLKVESKHFETISVFIILGLTTSALSLPSAMLTSVCYVYGFGLRLTIIALLTTCLGFGINWALLNHTELGIYSLFVAQLCTTFLLAAVTINFLRKKDVKLLNFSGFAQFKPIIKSIAAIAIPVFVSFCFLIFQSGFLNNVLSKFSEDTVSGYGVAYRIQNLILLPAIAIGIALAIRVNILRSINQSERIHSMLKIVLGSLFVIYICLGLGLFLMREFAVGLITTDQSVLSEGVTYLMYLAPSYIAFCPLLSWLVMQEQIGLGARSLVFNFVSIGLQSMLIVYWVFNNADIETVYRIMASWHVLAALYIFYELPKYKNKTVIENKFEEAY